MSKYSCIEYARSRLLGTMVFAKGKPVVVEDCYDQHLVGFDPSTKEMFEYDWEDVDLKPPSVGYINHGTRASYLMRYPARQWKQGIRLGQFQNLPNGVRLTGPSFLKAVTHKFPKANKCVEDLLNEEKISEAFDKNFSFFRSGEGRVFLHFKGFPVGLVTNPMETVNEISWVNGNDFLTETYQEALSEN